AAAVTLEHLDETLRRLGAACAATGVPVPAVVAVQLADAGVTLHLLEPTDLSAPWQDAGEGQHWFLLAGTPMEQVGPLPEDSPAPFPLLVCVGAGDDGSAWLLNLEDQQVYLTGAGEYVEDLARYLAAEVAVNPWSAGVRLDCVGIAQEVAPMNPARVRVAGPEAVEDLVAEVVGVIDRVGEGDVPTARVCQDGEDTWPARLVLLSTATTGSSPATDELRELLSHHAGRTGASIVVRGGAPTETAIQIEATEGGRILIPGAGLDLVGVGLTVDEATGCAALLAQSQEEPDVPMPAATPGAHDQNESWRDWTDQAGAIRPEHTVPREAAVEVAVTLLPEDDDAYEKVAATTAADLSALSPRVKPDVAQQVFDADPTLDEDVAAWWGTEARVPKLTLLGPVKAKTWGKPLAVRKAYLTELLAYLALHPQGVTTEETAEAFGITEAKTRDYVGRCREWLGQDPTTGELHLPHAQDTPAARVRGVNVYQVIGLLVDVDLFRRLRTRAGVRGGAEGIEDLKQALRLVQGRPFDQLRPGGWGWLFEGDRLDHHMTCAVVDVAHIVATYDLQTGDLAGARAAAEIAFLAAPHEEIPTLDLAAVTAREGHTTEAVRLLQKDVCNRTDDPDLPPGDLPERTQQILDRHGWLGGRKEAV
nr:bacterial transcriptional activator domain-containing protein [Actinomycetota bacterium]